MSQVRHLHLTARCWFDQVNGNTYHSVTVDDGQREPLREDFAYGYDHQYEVTAAELIEQAGWLPERRRNPNNGARQAFHRWLDEHGVTYETVVENVSRKQDL